LISGVGVFAAGELVESLLTGFQLAAKRCGRIGSFNSERDRLPETRFDDNRDIATMTRRSSEFTTEKLT